MPSPNQLWPRFRLLFDPSPRLTTHVRKVYERVVASYTEAHRVYHDLVHIAACLTFADEHPCTATSLQRSAELAIWWHDIEYQPDASKKASSDESRSAHRFSDEAPSVGVDPATVQAVHTAILATRHLHTPGPLSLLSAYVIDVDLSILASDPINYDSYVALIRQEYAHVNDDDWHKGRGHFLTTMLQRSRIFVTEDIRLCRTSFDGGTRYEDMAKLNMNRELKGLEK